MRGSSSMDVSSIPRLCLSLIGFAFQRCRLSSDLCRLSVLLSSPSASNPSVLQVSISDTGVGSCLEEFHAFKCPSEAIASQNWDGSLAVRTTSISDLEVYHYQLNLRETNPIRRLIRLPSKPKNGVKFSGTEVCLYLSESIHVLLAEIRKYFQKILVLNIPNVAIELVAEGADIPGSRLENVFLANESNPLPFSASNIERLKSGLENYLLKHGQSLSQKCECFPWKDLKVGSGTACSIESHRSSGLRVEVVIVLSEVEASCSHIKACSSKTEVLYFKDFSPCSIPQSSLKALTSIDWKSFGLSLRDVDPDGHLIEWENSPSHIAMVIHSYHKQVIIPLAKHKNEPDCYLIKRAVKFALTNLKEKYAGVLLSVRALKIRSYAPDLARSIAGLIQLSNDPDFQGDCFSILGLQPRDIGEEALENCIKNKIISVIEINDRKVQRSQELGPLLFEDGGLTSSNSEERDFEDGDEEDDNAFSYFDQSVLM